MSLLPGYLVPRKEHSDRKSLTQQPSTEGANLSTRGFSSYFLLAAGWERLGLSPFSRLPQHTSAPGGHPTPVPRSGGHRSPDGARAAPRGSAVVGSCAPAWGGVWLRGPRSRGPLRPGLLTVCGPTGPQESPRGCVSPHAGPSGPLRGPPFLDCT